MSAFKDQAFKKTFFKEFAFENDQRNNTDYTIVNGPMYQELVSENVEKSTYERFRHVNTVDFKKQLDRPDITKLVGSGAHEERFNVLDSHFNSKFLTKTPTVKCSNPLDS